MKRLLLATLALVACGTTYAATIYVAPTGSSKGDGSQEQPFNSLESARNKIRNIKASGYDKPIDVIIKGGDYALKKGFELFAMDSGKRDAPIRYRCEEGDVATFFGGDIIDHEWFTPMDESSSFAQRLVDKKAASQIVVASLKEHSITEYGTLASHGWGLEPPERVPAAMLSIGGERMTLSRWPNADEQTPYIYDPKGRLKFLNISPLKMAGYVSYSSVVDRGVSRMTLPQSERAKWYESPIFTKGGGTVKVEFNRMKHWADSDDIFVDGVLSASWEWIYNRVEQIDRKSREIKLEMGAMLTGLGDKCKVSHFYFENVAEELNSPGEYYIDRKAGLLYLYPPKDFEKKTIVLSTLNDPAIRANRCSNVSFENIRFDTGRNLFAELLFTDSFKIINCTIANYTKGGINSKGRNNLFRGNEIYSVGGYGILLDGGNLTTLERGDNIAEYNYIHDFGWDQKSQIPALYIQGVGNTLSHNKIENGPHFAIRMTQCNDNVIEYNEISDVVKYHHFDGGALYVYNTTNPEQRGNIIRNNYFHHIHNKRNAIYLDNHTMGVLVEGNLFSDLECAVNINSGHHNNVVGNLMVNVPSPVNFSKFSYNTVYKQSNLGGKWRQITDEMQPKIASMPHSKYPELIEWLEMDDETKRLGVSRTANNLFANPSTSFSPMAKDGVEDELGSMEVSGNVTTRKRLEFADFEKGDYSLSYDKDGLKITIEQSKMGLNGYRVGVK